MARRLAAEALGTALLLIAVMGSAILFSWLLRGSSAETGLRRERKDWP
jgi:hypothetical protein